MIKRTIDSIIIIIISNYEDMVAMAKVGNFRLEGFILLLCQFGIDCRASYNPYCEVEFVGPIVKW